MNAGAPAYTPSPHLCAVVSSKSTSSSAKMTPLVGPNRPNVLPQHRGAPASAVGPAPDVTTLPMSAADHLRQLHKAGVAHVASPPPGGVVPRPVSTGRVRYSRDALLSMQQRALEVVRRGPITDEPPFLKIPVSFVPLLRRPFALEYVDVDAATALVEGRGYASPLLGGDRAPTSSAGVAGAETSPSLTTGNESTDVRNYHCAVCHQGGAKPCPALAEVMRNATRYAMRTKEGACLLQAPEVVTGLLQLLLVFESKKSSMRMRLIAETHPAIVRRVAAFLCGEGYHLPLPSVTAHDSWRTMMSLLKFDAIRDNRTRIIHDFSKHWKKRHTPFEQFVYFFSFRYAVPVGPAKNIPTCSVKPGMVAMLSGDVMAMVLLHHLNFFIPPDYYWTVYPYLHQALGEGTLAYDVIRHLGAYMSSHQDASVFFNPIEDPATRGGRL